MKGIGNTLNNPRLINYLGEHSEMTTKDIRDQFYPNRRMDSMIKTLNLIKEEDFILDRRENMSTRGTTEFTWSLKNS